MNNNTFDAIAEVSTAIEAIKAEGIRFRKGPNKNVLAELKASDNAAWIFAMPTNDTYTNGDRIENFYTIYTSTPEVAERISELLKEDTHTRSLRHPEENNIELIFGIELKNFGLEYVIRKVQNGYQM